MWHILCQNINLRFVMVVTGTSRCSKATISSADTMLFLMFRHSNWLYLNAFASISMSSMMMRLLDMSRSFNEVCFDLMTSLNLAADSPEIFVDEMWHTLMELDWSSPCASLSPLSSPICGLSLRRSSLRLLLSYSNSCSASPDSALTRLWLKKRRSNLGKNLQALNTWLAPLLLILLYSKPKVYSLPLLEIICENSNIESSSKSLLYRKISTKLWFSTRAYDIPSSPSFPIKLLSRASLVNYLRPPRHT